ncbi:hypothetical protein APY04_3021 [Hyphomicrobium sulfonivorans]|uniref:Uncharacterized protein n=1 Tax=Hyphomicrobium sulfonivorans TaxID=121290 RepID=A0A109BB06_HYPSL|nr:hypothetical protein APY04_3021 [Hyphomicrobium sulfonivorans]
MRAWSARFRRLIEKAAAMGAKQNGYRNRKGINELKSAFQLREQSICAVRFKEEIALPN